MKIRTGFVSNSSSSSFIITISPSNKCPHCGRSDNDIINLIENSNNYCDNEVLAEGKEEVIEQIKEWFEYDENNPAEQDLIKKINDVDSDKKHVVMIVISNHDETLRNLMYDSKNIEVLHSLSD